MASSEKCKRKSWTREETNLLLQCYAARKGEFAHSRKKKFGYTNVLKDMMSQGFADSNMTVLGLECKMRTLLAAYKSVKDNRRRTIATQCITPYMQAMDGIFGNKPLTGSEHTFHLRGVPKPAFDAVLTEATANAAEEQIDELKLEMPASPSYILPIASPTTNIPSNPSTPSSSSKSSCLKRKSAREAYYEGKLELEKTLVAAKIEQRMNFYNSYLEIEKQKVAAIHKLFEIKQKNQKK